MPVRFLPQTRTTYLILGRVSRPVLRPVRQHPAHPAPRVFLVAAVTRDQVDMQVRHTLAAGLAMVDTNVVTVWLVVPVEDVLGLRQHPEQDSLLGISGFEQSGEVTARDDDGVAERDGEPVAVGYSEFVFSNNAVGVKLAERTGFGIGWTHALGDLVLLQSVIVYPTGRAYRPPVQMSCFLYQV